MLQPPKLRADLSDSRGVVIQHIHVAAKFIVDMVYPRRCANCDKRGTWLCSTCDASLHRFEAPWCARCGVPVRYATCRCSSMPENLEQMRSIGPFEGWLRGAIIQFKYHGEWGRAAHLGRPLATAAADLRSCDALAPVPLHPSRHRQRGFNQSLLLAREAGMLLGLAVEDVLTRTRRTDAQVQLGLTDRLANVAGAFSTRPGKAITGKSYVLIDDVVTTGATLSACADALYAAGAASVKAATVAREM